MSEWPHNQEWAKEGWPKTAEDIWTLIEMGVWYDEKDKKLIEFNIAQELYECLKGHNANLPSDQKALSHYEQEVKVKNGKD